MGVQPQLKPIVLSSTYTITGLYYTYRYLHSNEAYLSKLFLQTYYVKQHL